MTTSTAEKIVVLGNDYDLVHQIVHGDKNIDVPTEGGGVPSVAKLFESIEQREAQAVANARQAAQNSADSAAFAAETLDTAKDTLQQEVRAEVSAGTRPKP